MLPGPGSSIVSFLGYNEAKRVSKCPEKFGTGISEGIAASEAANIAIICHFLIPLLTLSIPRFSNCNFTGVLMIHGLRLGFGLFANFADIIYPFIIGLLCSNIIMFFWILFC